MCEAWIDGKIVFQDDNCAGHYATKSKAEIPIDFSNCKGKTCLLRFYWLTLQEPKWQVYRNCVPLIGKSEARAEAKMTMTTNSYGSTPTPIEYSPSPTPAVASTGSGTSYLAADPATPEPTPAPTSSSPAPASAASPTVNHHKCKGKKHRGKHQHRV
ncbi:hypothetical protein Gpo141_00009221 [Globisporangium polare]